ncbi:histone-fold-containing protein [Lineolata rhizophorae]|uniref:Histone H4 n=1 Tax=Lineolata rhizophorae TaxID=578093 RepID=A0A6A6P593_9PEZI|nr:histone-fold-containing protein [Lineolata rhizophorae]
MVREVRRANFRAGNAAPPLNNARAPFPGGHAAGLGGKGLGKTGLKRHRKVLCDNIQGVTKGAIRRLARRGGVKRISGTIYHDIRNALKIRLETILKDCCAVVEFSNRKTVTVVDVIYALNRLGTPIYGFDPEHKRMKPY